MKEYVRQDTAGLLVEALCADFGRRERMREDRSVPLRVRVECRYINARLLEAVRSLTVDEAEACLFLREIGERRGYAHSDSPLSESAYKRRKAEIRTAILKTLHLC